MSGFPEPLRAIIREVLEEYISHLPPQDGEILRKYYIPVSETFKGIKDTLRAANKTDDEILADTIDQVCSGIPERRKKKIYHILDKAYKYSEPRIYSRVLGYKTGVLCPDGLIPGSNCHYTKEFLLKRNALGSTPTPCPDQSEGDVIRVPLFKTAVHDLQSSSKVTMTKVDLDEFLIIKIIDLVPSRTYSNRVIYATLLDDGFMMVAYHTVIQDEFEQCAKLCIYKITTRLHESLKKGTKIAVINPYYKLGEDGFHFIRVDSPGEVVLLLTDEIRNEQNNSNSDRSSDDHKKEGNEFFKTGHYNEAITCYTRAIAMDSSNPVFVSNRALCYLKLELYEEALHDSQTAVRLDPNTDKYHYRLAIAWSGLKDHEKSVEILENINTSNADIKSALVKERILLSNSKGKFDFEEMGRKLKRGEEVKVADYIGPVSIETSPAHGHGVFATRDIERGELIVVCKAVAYHCMEEAEASHPLLEYDPRIKGGAVTTQHQIMFQQVLEKISNSKLEAFRVFYLNNKRVSEASIDTGIYKGKGYSIIQDKPKPPYQMEQIREIVSDYSVPLHFSQDPNKTKEEGVFKSVCLWLVPPYFNHSCVPNVFRKTFKDICIIHTCTFIPEGSELNISHCDLYSTFSLGERREMLEQKGIYCKCTLCEFESDLGNANLLQRAINLRERAINLSESNPDGLMQDSHFELLDQTISIAEELNLGRTRFNAAVWHAFHYSTKNFTNMDPRYYAKFIEAFNRAKPLLCDSEVWHQFFYWNKLRNFFWKIVDASANDFALRNYLIHQREDYMDEVDRKFCEADSFTNSIF